MSNTHIVVKRTTVAGRIPNTSFLATGELALNITDKRLLTTDGINIFDAVSNVQSFTINSTTLSTTVFVITTNTANQVIDSMPVTSIKAIEYSIFVSNSTIGRIDNIIAIANTSSVVTSTVDFLDMGMPKKYGYNFSVANNTLQLSVLSPSSNLTFKIFRKTIA